MNTTANHLVEFLEKAGSTGRIKPVMATQLTAAVRKVFDVEQNWEEIDVSQLDVDGLLVRFKNLKGLEYAPNSLSEYDGRFRRAIKMFLGYAQDPSGWKHNGGSSVAKKTNGAKASSKTKSNAGASLQHEIVETSNIAINPAGIQMMDYPFPLRESCIVRLRLPADLKTSEVERLAAFMRSVAFDVSN